MIDKRPRIIDVERKPQKCPVCGERVVDIHRHPTKDETFVLLRGRVRVNTYNDDGTVIESVILCPEEGLYGVDIPKGVWIM